MLHTWKCSKALVSPQVSLCEGCAQWTVITTQLCLNCWHYCCNMGTAGTKESSKQMRRHAAKSYGQISKPILAGCWFAKYFLQMKITCCCWWDLNRSGQELPVISFVLFFGGSSCLFDKNRALFDMSKLEPYTGDLLACCFLTCLGDDCVVWKITKITTVCSFSHNLLHTISRVCI